jgi:hypothetical protein
MAKKNTQRRSRRGGARRRHPSIQNVVRNWVDAADMEEALHLSGMDLEARDMAAIPAGVKYLYIEENYVDNIDELPDSIVVLHVDGNPIQRINHLPANLEEFAAAYGAIEYIREFPPGLTDLHLAENWLENGLPPLPDGLETLFLIDNRLPDGYVLELPSSLTRVQLDANTEYVLTTKGGAEPFVLPSLGIGRTQYTNVTIYPAEMPIEVPLEDIEFTDGDMTNALLTNLRDGNIVAKLTGPPNSTNSRDYLLINAGPAANEDHRAAANEQKTYLLRRGNPVTKERVNIRTAAKRRVRTRRNGGGRR